MAKFNPYTHSNFLHTHSGGSVDEMEPLRDLAASVLWSAVIDYHKFKAKLSKATKQRDKMILRNEMEACLYDLQEGHWHDLLGIRGITKEQVEAAADLAVRYHKGEKCAQKVRDLSKRV